MLVCMQFRGDLAAAPLIGRSTSGLSSVDEGTYEPPLPQEQRDTDLGLGQRVHRPGRDLHVSEDDDLADRDARYSRDLPFALRGRALRGRGSGIAEVVFARRVESSGTSTRSLDPM